jgi:hypothetical protein
LTERLLRAFAYVAAANGNPLPALAEEAEALRHRPGGVETDLRVLAVKARGGMHGWKQVAWFRATASFASVIWTWARCRLGNRTAANGRCPEVVDHPS